MPAYDPITNERPLAGRRIALVEHRELDRLGRMLEEQGAETLRCPLLAIADAPDQAMVRAWIERAIAAPFDDLVLMTGEGLRRLLGAVARTGLETGFREALARMRTITRGPKPARALREIGLSPRLRAAPNPTRDGSDTVRTGYRESTDSDESVDASSIAITSTGRPLYNRERRQGST